MKDREPIWEKVERQEPGGSPGGNGGAEVPAGALGGTVVEPPLSLPATRQLPPASAEVLEPQVAPSVSGRPRRGRPRGRPLVRRFIRPEAIKESIKFIEDVRDGRIDDWDGEPVDAALRLEAAKFLVARGLPLPAPELPDTLPEGITSIVLITRSDDPPV